jgi:hypothetical protein
MTAYAVHKDISDELLANAMYPEQVFADTVELCKKMVINALMRYPDPAIDLFGEVFYALDTRHWRHVVEPFDYEDEFGLPRHSEGYSCTRVEVTGRIIEEKS